ncbi:MAG: retroviral-like aspartic protease family protein [Alphaproteobacteria bacterium]|jgi:clan AA aspartic protease, TIGR02281 family|nr:retroviral-like aspartic protease family protein [Alphaproteobacteria bacterium]MBU0793835.1 retroviral-like aspartic protease family protein [Alphaproteobacteria bacterium]MBU0875394.1 retroviral-like aspartic protease family protein [Alphaproteobacteria bacterium]MBU1768104.1 retroviral-like aspartic protease family protein [Alphaproteobacteria bacterium]
MFGLHLEFGSIMAATASIAVALSTPFSDDRNHQKEAAAHIAVPESISADQSGITLPASTVQRHSDGLFYVEAQANGHSIRFIVDTGATVVVLNRADAAKLGLAYESLPGRASMRTVSGSSDMRWAKIERMEMAGKQIEGISAAVIDGALPVSLMGQNALEQLGTVTLRGDTLTIQ